MLEGKIERQGFLDTLQLLSMSRKSGRLEITGEAEGICFFSQGELLDCRMDQLSGDQAFIELFVLVSGRFTFQEGKVSVPKRIQKSLTDLLMKASKQASAWEEALEQLPCQHAALILLPQDPAEEKKISVDALDWSIISQIDGRRSFPQIAGDLKQPKTTVAIRLSRLKKQGLITTEDPESSLLRTVFSKTADLLYHLIHTRAKPRIKKRTITEFNRWSFSQGSGFRLTTDKGMIDPLPHDTSLKERSSAYCRVLGQLCQTVLTVIDRNELGDHLADLYERFSKEERKVVADSGLKQLLSPEGKRAKKEPDLWEGAGPMGTEGIIPR